MKIYIMTDLEGPAGVNRWVQTREGETPEKAMAMRLLTGEVNAAIEGILAAQPKAEILVWDGHGMGGGLVFEDLHPRAQVVMHGVGMGAPHQLDSSFDAVFFVGQHAMAGTANAPLCHTYSSRTVEEYRLNGIPVGEIGCFAGMAGSMGVPTVFLSGDDKACVEAEALIPGVVTVTTKIGLGLELALHKSKESARQAIYEGARKALSSGTMVAPLTFTPLTSSPPFELEIRLQEGCPIDTLLSYGMERIDERTAVKRSADFMALFS